MTMQQWLGISDSHLVKFDEKHSFHAEVVQPFLTLQSNAQRAGIDLQLVSSFRGFNKQCSIWERKWNGQLPLLSAENQVIPIDGLTDTEKMHAILHWSALPGASRHHWGTDMDVYDKSSVENSGKELQLIEAEYRGNGPCALLSDWLDKNASKYGFYRPYANFNGGIGAEPWHISFKPVADKIARTFDKQQLHELIATSKLSGKSIVLQHFDEIYYRYVLNHGIPRL